MRKLTAIFFLGLALIIGGCEEVIDVDFPESERVLVMEGFVESGQFPYVILSQSLGFFAKIDTTAFIESGVTGADVYISDGTQRIKMTQAPGFPLYFVTNQQMKVQEGLTYTIETTYNGDEVKASTTIQSKIGLDSVYVKPEVIKGDTFYRLMVKFSEPDPVGNHYRYFTRKNSEDLFDTENNSVFDDNFINGKTLDLPLNGVGLADTTENAGFETFGLFNPGDTIYLKWAHISKPHFNFWRTYETQVNNVGNPFAPVTVVNSNVQGGIGVWGDYNAFYDTLIAK
ncbi:MAG: hypothetical protein ACI81S_001387 [Sphingobacteriales bacterium]|jgi:hypothetical protein